MPKCKVWDMSNEMKYTYEELIEYMSNGRRLNIDYDREIIKILEKLLKERK